MARTVDLTNVEPPATTDAAGSPVRGGHAYLADVERRLAPYFERTEPRQRALAYLPSTTVVLQFDVYAREPEIQ
jgi:hypothetical protein